MMPMEKTQKPTNRFISLKLIDDLNDSMRDFSLQECAFCMENLGCSKVETRKSNGLYVTMSDLACMYGQNILARTVGPLWFKAGPRKSKDSRYIKATALHFCMDTILYNVHLKGWGVLEKLEIFV